MCGIYGACIPIGSPRPERGLSAARELLRHRGPDGEGEIVADLPSASVTLGHRRLAIIDLSEGGRQPMWSECGRFVIVFNGEIYNYRELRSELQREGIQFRSDSDTEVLLAAWGRWGERCLPRLVGMFAFAVLDTREGTLVLVRDAFGIKPLFHALDGNRLVFASELPALLALRGGTPSVDVQSAHDFLRWGECDVGFPTFVQGVRHLPPAFLARFVLDGSPLRPEYVRWWSPPLEESRDISFKEAVDRFRELFLDSVRLHLRSDVPLGVALSGGLDSSSIACSMRMLEPDLEIHTFTYVGGPGGVDEEPWADAVNARIRARPHKIRISSEDLERDLEDLIRTQGEPFGSTTMYAQYAVLREARRSGIVVVLEGQGADELLAGYVGYPSARMQSIFERGQLASAIRFSRLARTWPNCGHYRPWRVLMGELLPPFARGAAAEAIARWKRPAWLSESAMRSARAAMRRPHGVPWKRLRGRRLSETLLNEMTWHGLPRLMRYGDRSAMRFSVENRVPFLTIPLAEFALTLPERFLVSDEGENKLVLRAAMRGIVPDEVLDRREKVAFRTPTGDWMRGRILRDLSSGRHRPAPGSLLDTAFLRETIERGVSGDVVGNQLAWRIFNVLAWQDVVLGMGEARAS